MLPTALHLISHEVGDVLKILRVVRHDFQTVLKRGGRDHEVERPPPRILALPFEQGAYLSAPFRRGGGNGRAYAFSE